MLYNIKRKAALEAAYQAWCMLMMQSYQLSICTCMTLQMVLSTRCRASTTTVRLHERRQGAVTGHVRALQLPRMLPWTPQGHHREHGMGLACKTHSMQDRAFKADSASLASFSLDRPRTHRLALKMSGKSASPPCLVTCGS